VNEVVKVSGTVLSDSIAYQELSMERPGKIRWVVNTNTAVNEGDILGYYEGEAVTAEYTGMFKSYSLSAGDAYIRYDTFDKLILEASVSEEDLLYLDDAADLLATLDGKQAVLERVSPLRNSNGSITVEISIPEADFYCGQKVTDLQLCTGRVYPNVLTLDIRCVYQKPGETGTWYVRQVDLNGTFIQETKVQVGYSNGDVVCVTGIEEGQYFDSGYKAVIEGGN